MRRSLLILSVAFLILVSARGQHPTDGERRRVEFRADYTRSVSGMPDSVMRLTGNVVMYHNGAVLTCDSAYRFGSKHIECYGRVLINKDDTYIYGDRAIYDGYANIAQVFAPLIKVVDGDATLYTYNFSFNTLDNIGRYWGRGMMIQKENMLESDRGYYYADTREFIAVDHVEATDPEYKLVSDSVRYNMDTETAEFYTSTTIWNNKGEIAYATRGTYHNRDARYEFTRDTYLLTKTQEIWCDSLDYDSRVEDAILRRDIQIRDDEQQVMAFGEFGQYWGAREEALLTENPSALSFDPEQDTTYMRADTMLLRSLAYELDFREYDSLRRVQNLMTLTEEQNLIGDEGHEGNDTLGLDLTAGRQEIVLPASDDQQHENYVDDWTGTEDAATRERLRWMVVELKREMFIHGDTLTREMITPGLSDTLLNSGYSSEDIEAQLLYNKRKRELEAEGLPVKTDSLIYEVLDAIGAFGNPPPPTESEIALDSLKKIESEMKLIEGGETGSEVETKIENTVADEEQEITGEVATEEQKSLSRRERKRLERENDTAEKADTNLTAVPVVQTGSLGDILRDSISDKLTDSLGGRLQDAGVDLGALLREIGGMDLSVASDSLRNKLQDMGVNTDALLQQAKEFGLDVLFPSGSLNNDTLSENSENSISLENIVTLPDSLMFQAQDSLAVQEVKPDSLQRVIFGNGNVRIYRTDMQAVCDSLVAFSKDSTAHLYINPVMWHQQNQITSDVMDIFSKNKQIHRAFFTGSPMMVSEVDSTQFNQIKGREMEAFFHNNEIYWHNVMGNAQTLYYMMDEAAGEPNGFLVVNSASIAFHIKEQKVDRLAWYKEITVATYPLDKIPLEQNRFLDGFSWEIVRRPELKDVFNRTIRPSQREIFEALPLPLFPISEDIERDKKKFTEMRIWEDRTDTLLENLSVEGRKFLHNLGVIE